MRGESVPLSDGERNEALQSAMSYYPTDLLAAGWVGALVYDTPTGAAATIQLLEYANTQLIEALVVVILMVELIHLFRGGW